MSDTAIEALRYSEFPNSSDCISRQAAIDAIFGRSHEIIKMRIGNLPSAQPERIKGHWVSQRGGGYRCSECGRYALDEVDGNFIHVSFKSNFCPYCGADMRGEQDDQ